MRMPFAAVLRKRYPWRWGRCGRECRGKTRRALGGRISVDDGQRSPMMCSEGRPRDPPPPSDARVEAAVTGADGPQQDDLGVVGVGDIGHRYHLWPFFP